MSKSLFASFSSEKEDSSFFAALAIVLACLIGPLLWPADPAALHYDLPVAPPSWLHPLGTDELGRDELARLLQGGLETLKIAVPAAALAFAIGVAFGLLAGMVPASGVRLLAPLLDALLALPPLVVLLCGAALLPRNAVSVAVLIGVTAWPALARLVLIETVSLRGRDFAWASRLLGAGAVRMALHHYVPNMRRLLAVNAMFLLGDAILALSAMSFLGLGVPPPAASWGGMLQGGLGLIDLGAWWLILPPGLAITACLLATGAAGRRV
ncbi:MAG TPA: ABC transporter permease [Acetobacteraceae bacterium]|nr:ABC transporter permease [Acetobacteraceae bacterium]